MPDQLEDQLLVARRFKLPVGQNSNDVLSSLQPYEVGLLQNAIVTSRGKRSTRPGSTAIADSLGAYTVDGLGKIYPVGGTKQLLKVVNGSIYKYTAGASNWTSIASGLTPARTRFLVGNGYALSLDGVNNAQSYDGTTVADEGNLDASCPRGLFGIFHKNMFIVGGVTSAPSDFFLSTVGTKTFARSTRVHKVGNLDNGIMKAIVPMSLTDNHGFLVMKDDGIYFVDSSDTDYANWDIRLLTDAFGLAGYNCFAVVGNSGRGLGDVFFLSNDGARGNDNKFYIRSILKTINDKIQGSGIISSAIQPVLDDLNASQVDKCVATYFDNKFFLAFPSGGSTYNDSLVVLDLNTSSPDEGFWDWSVWTGVNVAWFETFIESGVKRLYYAEASGTARTYKFLTGTSDNGTAIAFAEEGRGEDFDVPEVDKIFQWVETEFEATDDTEVTVKASVDSAGMTILGTVNVESNAPTLPVNLPFNLASSGIVRKKFQLEDLGVGREIQIGVYHEDLDKAITYLGYTLAAFPENVEMGDD